MSDKDKKPDALSHTVEKAVEASDDSEDKIESSNAMSHFRSDGKFYAQFSLADIDKKTKELRFNKELIDALFAFQLLEGMLRTYIDMVFNTIRLRLTNDDITFNHNADGIHGLGKLMDHFKKYCDNAEVLKVLTTKLSKERNFVAHEIVYEFNDKKEDNESHIERLKQSKKLAQDATNILVPELRRMLDVHNKETKKHILAAELQIKNESKDHGNPNIG